MREVLATAGQLLTGLSVREQLPPGDGKSDALLERASLDGRRVVIKHIDLATDWLARATGELRCRHVLLWQAGVLDELPTCLDHATLGCAEDAEARRATLLLEDVTPYLLPGGNVALTHAQHRRFLEHMAALHARFWGRADEIGLLALPDRYLTLSPRVAAAERADGGRHVVPTELIPQGWQRLPAAAPSAGPVAVALINDLGPLLAGLAGTPSTLLHGDWKASNLGIRPDGRTILLDWAMCGFGPACADLAWYLAVNAALLPESKEAAIAAYRWALRERGINTEPWWHAQLGLSLIGAFLMLGWDKTAGDPAELAWWDTRVAEAVGFLP